MYVKIASPVFLLVSLLLMAVTRAHRPIDCFNEGNVLGWSTQQEDIPNEKSDLDLIMLVDREHELTSIKVRRTRSENYIRGVQVSYGQFNGAGELVDAVSLNMIGDLDQASFVCDNFYIPKDDYLSSILYRYNVFGV